MTQEQLGAYGGPMMSPPPQHPGELGIPPRQSTWPTVIGVILIVFGSLGLLMYGCGGVANAFMPTLMDNAAPSTGDPMMDAQAEMTRRYMAWNIANAAVLFALGIVLLAAGIGVLRRRRSGITAARAWAVLRIVWAVPVAFMTYQIMIHTFKAMEQAGADSGQGMPAGMAGIMQSLGVVGVVINVAFTCALPVFVLIWFSRAAVKSETASWT